MTTDQYLYINTAISDIKAALLFCHVYDVPCEEVIVFLACQSALETGYGTSSVYRENHNLFGMKYPKVRFSYSSFESNKHAFYEYRELSIIDYFVWLLWCRFPLSSLYDLSEFKAKLSSSCFNPSKNYVSTIESIYIEYLKLSKNDK